MPIKVALIHDWLTGMRGGESVLEAIAELFENPHLFTLICDPTEISPALRALPLSTSWLQKVPAIKKRYRSFLPLMPHAIEQFDLSGYDLVVSSSHCVAKGARKAPGAVHVSYVHAPMRYMWERFEDYFGEGRASLSIRFLAHGVRGRMQRWDKNASAPERIDRLIANSYFIQSQIKRAYGRDAEVIYPFADLSRFSLPRESVSGYLMVGAFAPNKRVDIAIEAFNRLKLSLLIVGSGQEEAKLKALAGPTIRFLGSLPNEEVTLLYSRCRAFIFPGIEDFGITPLEAMASGAPVIAYGVGGASETVTRTTGILFHPQSAEKLMEAVLRIESGETSFDPEICRSRAQDFTREAFQRKFLDAVREAWSAAGKDPLLLAKALSNRARSF